MCCVPPAVMSEEYIYKFLVFTLSLFPSFIISTSALSSSSSTPQRTHLPPPSSELHPSYPYPALLAR